MAHVISNECISCGTCEGECPSALFLRATASTRSMLIPASIAALALVRAPWVRSLRADFLVDSDKMGGGL